MQGRMYTSVMCWYAEERTDNLSPSTNAQQRTLRDLLRQMSQNQSFVQLLSYTPTIPIKTIVETTVSRVNHRIDNQNPVTLTNPSPRLNLQYQIGSNSYATVIIHLKPNDPPNGFENRFIYDADVGFSFPRIEGSMQHAFKFSTKAQSQTHIKWYIFEIPELQPGSHDRDHKMSAGEAVKMAMTKVLSKIRSESSVKVGAKKKKKKCVDTTAAVSAAKDVPFLGAGIGIILGAYRLYEGDLVGALAEVASGVVSSIPGSGTAASVGIDVALAAQDVSYSVDEL